MAMTFDATLKDMGRECPEGFLTAFDRAPAAPVSVLNVDLSAVTAAADIIYGLGEPLREIIHIDCQSSAAAWKHADLTSMKSCDSGSGLSKSYWRLTLASPRWRCWGNCPKICPLRRLSKASHSGSWSG